MEPFDLNAIEVNVEMNQNDSPEHIVWNDGRQLWCHRTVSLENRTRTCDRTGCFHRCRTWKND